MPEVHTIHKPMQARGSSGATIEFDLGTGNIQLDEAMAGLRALLRAEQVDERAVFCSLLVFEELLNNILLFAHPKGEMRIVRASAEVRAGVVHIVTEDDGLAFNPLEARIPTPPTSIADAKVGGLGLLLVRKMAHALTYERTDGVNRVHAQILPGLRAI